ncbi:hypothetical protein H9Q69_007095 [Fusarium xylarioides]|nr:hypothetical protein H9Q69_007095 [Fusarium xylarioides]
MEQTWPSPKGPCPVAAAQQIVQQFDTTAELPPTVEFSALTLRDHLASSILPDEVQPGPDRISDIESDPESEAGPTLLPSSPSHLTAYLENAQKLYFLVNAKLPSLIITLAIRPIFDIISPNSHERAEPENTYKLQEHTEHISRSLPPSPTIFAERDSTCDPRASFPQWRGFLSNQPAEPLSLRKTQASLPHGSVTVARQWDVDSIWFGEESLSAIRAPGHFRLSFFPAYKSNISTAQVIQPHSLNLAHTRHTSIGTFTTAGVRFSVLLFFPNGARSRTNSSTNILSLARFRDLYDEIILLAIFETVLEHVRQEIPSSYDLLYAKSRAYQEKPGASCWSAEDESRAFRLSYGIPASSLANFCTSVVEKANMHRIQTRRGEAVPYFGNPVCSFKHTISRIHLHRRPLGEVWPCFGTSSWLDLMQVRLTWTLAGSIIVPEDPLVADQYRSYLLRDVGTYYAKARPIQASNPGHPKARSPGIIRAKAYNCSKDLFGVMFNDYQLFSSGLLPLLAFDEAMLKDLAATEQNRQRAFVSQLNRTRLADAWEAKMRHMRAIANSKRYPNFRIWKEVTLRLDVILAMWADGMLDLDQNPHTGPVC